MHVQYIGLHTFVSKYLSMEYTSPVTHVNIAIVKFAKFLTFRVLFHGILTDAFEVKSSFISISTKIEKIIAFMLEGEVLTTHQCLLFSIELNLMAFACLPVM